MQPGDTAREDECHAAPFGNSPRRESFATTDTDGPSRLAYLGDPSKTRYCSNVFVSSMYTWWNFVPVVLWNQFKLISNIYFGLNVVIALIPGVSPITPATAILPLLIVLGTAMYMEGTEDFQRHKADNKNNSAPVWILEGSEWVKKRSTDVKVGDLLRVEKTHTQLSLKADVLILSSSDDDGQVYIETSQLDGETSVKFKKAVRETQILQTIGDFVEKKGKLKVVMDEPVKDLYKWQGSARWILPDGTESAAFNLNVENTIWRSSSIRRTDWMVGLVLYTGKETKMGLNMEHKPRTRNTLDTRLNIAVLAIFILKNIIMIILCALSAAFAVDHKNDWYIEEFLDKSAYETFFLNYLTWFILLSFMIPISLFVTVRFCLRIQIKLMEMDQEMMHWMLGAGEEGAAGWVGCKPKTSYKNLELSNVKYIFSDKTGTLTENKMTYVGGAVPDGNGWVGGGLVAPSLDPLAGFHMPNPSEILSSDPKAPAVDKLMAAIVLCNTVVPVRDENDGTISYEGTSPDEVALVTAAREHGVVMTKRTTKSITIATNGVEATYTILAVLDFSSNRKMMSVVLQTPGGDLILLTKGADAHEGLGKGMFERVDSSNDESIPADFEHTEEAGDGEAVGILKKLWNTAPIGVDGPPPDHAMRVSECLEMLQGYGRKGWRTLVFGWRTVTPEWFNTWNQTFEELRNATLSLKGPHKDHRKEELEDAAKLAMERELVLGGLIAYEDMLQDEVPETIKFFLDADVAVWMLTGDKLETAIEIAKSCNLAKPGGVLFEAHLSKGVASPSIRKSPEAIAQDLLDELTTLVEEHADNEVTLATDETTLSFFLGDKMREDFLVVSRRLRSAVCARLTPKMKGTIVKSCMDLQEMNGTVLAIGDGGNDVTMINEAHVGIGIIGIEGRAAELASDYAIPRFRHLKRLLTIHGKYSRYRTAMCIGYSFYKNIVLSLCQVYFAVFSGYSAQTLFDSWLLAVINTVFTGAPPFFMGCFEKDLHEEPLMHPVTGPYLYKHQRDNNMYMNTMSAVMWVGTAFLHSVFVFWFWYPTMRQDDIGDTGRTADFVAHGTAIITGVILVTIAKAVAHIKHHTSLQFGSIVFSYAFYFSFIAAYAAIPMFCFPLSVCETHFYGITTILFGSAKFWLYCLFIGLAVPYITDVVGLYVQRQWFPSYMDLVQTNDFYPEHEEWPVCCCAPNPDLEPCMEEIETMSDLEKGSEGQARDPNPDADEHEWTRGCSLTQSVSNLSVESSKGSHVPRRRPSHVKSALDPEGSVSRCPLRTPNTLHELYGEPFINKTPPPAFAPPVLRASGKPTFAL